MSQRTRQPEAAWHTRAVRLQTLVFGAGAIGAYVGGSLARLEHPVTFIERPEVAAELRDSGLSLQWQSGKGTHRHWVKWQSGRLQGAEGGSVRVVGSMGEALEQSSYDVGILALKAYDTQTALATFAELPQGASIPPFLCLQNGVDNEPALMKVLGTGKVIAGTVTSAIGRRAAGDIVVERLRGVGIAAGHPLSERLVAAFNEAGLNAHLYPQAEAMKWSKLLTNLLANASSAILGLTPSEVFAHPGLFQLEISQLREALAVMDALELHVVDLPRTPVRALAMAVKWLPVALAKPILSKAVGSGRGGKMPSLFLDLQAGREQSEVEALNGAVVRYGMKAGIKTPVNRLLTETLLALTRRDIPRERFDHQPEALLARIDHPSTHEAIE